MCFIKFVQMPRVKRPLTDLKEGQYYRRVKLDPVSVLVGNDSQSPAYESADPGVSRAHNDNVVNENSLIIPQKKQISDSGSNYVEDDETVEHGIDGIPCVSSSGGPVDCVQCLNCVCFVECELCKHDHTGCHHCKECLNGEVILDSDYEPESSDDESAERLCCRVENIKKSSDQFDAKDSVDKTQGRAELANWAVTNQIKNEHLRQLLILLNTYFDANLPIDPRTILHTPSKTPVRSCSPGLYWHAGLERGLQSLDLSAWDGSLLEIDFGADGIPISGSSGSSFWPILCSVKGFDKIILAGAYHGNKKPDDANDFLRDFVDELKVLQRDGLVVHGRIINVKVKRLIADAQAKSFMCKCTGVTGYYSCTKCTVMGCYVDKRVVFLDFNAPLRTNLSFRSRSQEEHHFGETVLCELDFDLVDDVVLDWMHLVLLGVVRKLLHLFKAGKLGVRFQSSVISAISGLLEGMRTFISNDFVRKTRSLDYLKQFKATEFRLLILYVLPVALTPLLEHGYVDTYQNVLVLHVALVIMASRVHLDHYGTEYPEKLCRAFVEGFLNLYGNEQASHNLHGLIHLPRDVAKHGELDKFSAFRFENYLEELKQMVRKGEKPLQQLARRYMEAEAVAAERPVRPRAVESNSFVFSGKPATRCMLPEFGNPQYRCVTFPKFSLDLSPANRYCGVVCEKIVEIHHIAYQKNKREMVIVGKYFETKRDFYDYPLPSSHLGIYEVSNLSRELMSWPVSTVCRKYVCIPFNETYVVFPILHSM